MNATTEKSELEKAMEFLEKAGYVVGHPLSPAAKPYISELSDVLEAAGYRLDEAKIERGENIHATGRILLAIYPISVLEMKAKSGNL
jgi:hypothetical protein